MTNTRDTKQRRAILTALSTLNEFKSAQEIHEYLHLTGENIGLATVYRGLQSYVETGELDLLRGQDGEARYRRCSDQHHHHLVCTQCGDAQEISGPEVENWTAKIAAKFNYREVKHSLELFGVCPRCHQT